MGVSGGLNSWSFNFKKVVFPTQYLPPGQWRLSISKKCASLIAWISLTFAQMYFEAKLNKGLLVFALGKSPAVWVLSGPVPARPTFLIG